MISNNYAVIIPYYNKDFCIEDCLDSVEDAANLALDGLGFHINVFVIDDGSKKKFVDTKAYHKRYPHLIIHQYWRPNTKLTGARRDGIRMVREFLHGDPYIIHLDADDTLAEDAFNTIDSYINEHPDIDIYLFQFLCFTNNVFLPYYRITHRAEMPILFNKVYEPKIEWMYHANHNLMGKVCKLSNWLKVVNQGISLLVNKAEDAYLSAKLYYECKSMIYSDKYFYRYQFEARDATTFEKGSTADLLESHIYNICKFLSFIKTGESRKFLE